MKRMGTRGRLASTRNCVLSVICLAVLATGVLSCLSLFQGGSDNRIDSGASLQGTFGDVHIHNWTEPGSDDGVMDQIAGDDAVDSDGKAEEEVSTGADDGAEAAKPEESRPDPLPVPSVSAATAVVMELNSGMVLYDKGMDERIYPASTTKVMTALLAIEQGDLDHTVTVSENAAGVEGSSIYLLKDEEIFMRDLVYGLMLRSGNDAAIAIAEETAGSLDSFVYMMNMRAKEIGAGNTNFMNPNGLHNENHYTTAYDMALIARQAMLNPAFREIVGAKSWQASRADDRFNYFYNKNKVVFEYEGGTGVKIGYTTNSGRTLVASSKRGDMELICVVMNAPDWFNDSYKLMDYAYSSYQITTIAEGQKPIKTVPVKGGDKDYVHIGAKTNITCPVPVGDDTNISIEYAIGNQCQAPVSRWQEAGVMKIYTGDQYLYSVPLYYLEDIDHT